MAFLDRLFGGGRERALAEGIALLEEGRYAEAVAILRTAARRRSAPAGSLAAHHFRQALLAEGRRLLRANTPERAIPFFTEAVELWDRYPDLHFQLGTARGLSGAWDEALIAARAALRLNPDYVEARLLEATALQAVDRRREASDSLLALLESGRRVQHWLVGRLTREEPYGEDDLPTGLRELLAAAAGGQSEKEEAAAAVALCRAGRWEEGLERFGELVERQPRYPDYRTRYAAALFQLGRSDEALDEIEAALALNEDYALALDLKALILADGGRVAEARRCLQAADARQGEQDPARRTHEDLFGAYLRGVTALLTGHPEEVADSLEGWQDLVHGFGRAELLLAAAESLTAAPAAAESRLAALAREWSGEAVYRWLWACHLLEVRRYDDLAEALSRWPAAPNGERDWRPLYLEGHLAVCQGRVPARPVSVPPVDGTTRGDAAAGPGPDAWTYLAARAAFLGGDDEACWRACRELEEKGGPTERLTRLRLAAAAGAAASATGAGTPPVPWPDSCLPGLVWAEWRLDGGRAGQLLADQRRLHPEDARVNWLWPGFWLGPVRGWIA